MTENFLILMSNTKPQIQDTTGKTPRRIMLKYIIFKHQKIKDKEKKSSRKPEGETPHPERSKDEN